jgi:mannose-6-phosphate isomerase-like protein (cupin superfamily)
MGEKNSGEKGVSRREFFRIASTAGFGTAVGAYLLYGIPGHDFKDDQESSRHSSGVLFRIMDADSSDANSFSEAEIIMEPGSETFVMYNEKSEVTYEGISGEAIILTDEEVFSKRSAKTQRTTKKTVKPRKAYQILNPSGNRARIVQRFKPIWKSDESFIIVGNKKIRSSDLWFELRETFDRRETGLKCKIVKQSQRDVESLARVEPGVKSVCKYHIKANHSFIVTKGKGKIIVEGKEKELDLNDKIKIKHGTEYQLYNSYAERWELSVTATPGWLPAISKTTVVPFS